MNNATFAGRIGKDAALRRTPNDYSVANFSLAVNMRRGTTDETLWIDCALWGKRAESLSRYLTSGQSVVVAGEVGVRTYDSKRDQKTKAVLTLNVHEVTLISAARRSEPDDPPADQARSVPARAPADQTHSEDDIPF